MGLKFNLKGAFKISADPSEASTLIDDFLNEANKTILLKGAPKGEGAKVTDWSIGEKEIKLSIESGRFVRVGDAMLRLRKPLALKLGKEFRMGIRRIEIESFTIEIPSKESIKELKIPFVKTIEYKDEKIIVSLEIGESEIENRVPDRILNLIEDKIAVKDYGGKTEHWNLIWESEKKEHTFSKDPTLEMIDIGWIKSGTSRGQWIYGPEITKIFRTFEKIVVKELLEPLEYREMIFPKLVTWDVWQKSGHAKGVYPEIYYVCPPKTRDPAFWEEVIDYYKVTQKVPTALIKEKIGDPIGGLCYAQCPPFWPFLQGKTIAEKDFPIKVFDRSGTSHRYESGGIHGIERVDEFHRIEIVWTGSPEQVVEQAKKLHEQYAYIFNEILDLEWRKAWVTPWFMAQEGLIGLSESQDIGTTDYEAVLPYRGEDSEWLEFQNISVNGAKYTNGFNVKSQSNKELWSGCSGVGLERWAAAFFAQKGFDVDDWPAEFRKRVGKLPDGIGFL